MKTKFFSFLLLLLLVPTLVFANATITIVNGDPAGVGFNDPTPVAPVGGNPGTTRGQQRMIAAQFAADVWGQLLDSNVEIRILMTWEALSCNATSAVLASAGTQSISQGFPGAEFPGVWYHASLANKRSGVDRVPVGNPSNLPPDDIRVRFNRNLGTATCFAGSPFYYGLDGAQGQGTDMIAVALHEFGHGLGFSQFGSLTTGALTSGLPDVYSRNLRDNTVGLNWDVMSNAQRQASAINTGNVVWTGSQVTNEAQSYLHKLPILTINSPAAIAGPKVYQTASFGPPLNFPGFSANVVVALDAADAAGPSTSDGCSTILNAGAVAGKIALMDRGTCGFIVKAKNAQLAGAAGVLIANNAAAGLPGMGGADPTITIPALGISLADGNAIKANAAAGVNATFSANPSQLVGADGSFRVRINAPNPIASGSSISHWDPIASPNLLMEPANNADLAKAPGTPAAQRVDLTLAQMRDIGWYADADVDRVPDANDNCPNVANADQANNDMDAQGDACDADDDNDGVADAADNCPMTANASQANYDGDAQGDACDSDDDNDGVADAADATPFSDLRPTVIIGGCNSGVANTLFANGSTIADQIAALAASSGNHGNFVSALQHLLDSLRDAGTITNQQKADIGRCAARSN